MKLKRLHLQGFKSFKDKTTVHFDDGITGIVGPNGCGKSNIVDALFWIMGEMSAKHLRGNSMKDLIFAGSSKYSPGSFAEVSLVLENDDKKHIHIGNKVCQPEEIQLTRKLYRNGETEYRINNEPARLKDIQEVFMDTGAGAKSYSIIAQGEINRLVQSKPQERRAMIEEVAGITKFKMRRRESIKKIEATESNLSRLNDLQTEIHKQLKALEKQSQKAERAKSLKEKIRRNDLVVHAHKVFDLLRDFRDGKNVINERRLEVEGWSTKKNALEVSLEEERIQKTEQSETIEELQSEFNSVSKELAAAEERLNYLRKSCQEKEEQVQQLQSDEKEIHQEITERSEKLNELENERDEVLEESKKEFDFSAMELEVERIKEELSLKEESLKDIELMIGQEKEELIKFEQEKFKSDSKLEEFISTLEDVNEEIDSLESEFSKATEEIVADREVVENLQSEFSETEQLLQEAKENFRSLENDYQNTNNEFLESSKELVQKESRLNSLKLIQESLEGAKAGIGKFLESEFSEGYTTLGNLIEGEGDYVKAIENILDQHFGMLVTKNESLQELATWAEDNKDLPMEILIPKAGLDSEFADAKQRLEVNGCTGVVPLQELIKINNPDFKRILSGIFNGYFIVENLTEKLVTSLPREMSFKGLVSADGRVLYKADGPGLTFLTMGDVENKIGVVERNNEIKELSEFLTNLSAKVEDLESKKETLSSAFEEAKISLERISEKYADLKTELAAKKSAYDSKLENHGGHSSRLEILKNRKKEVSKARLEILENEESNLKALDSHKEKIHNLEERKESARSAIEDQSSVYQEKRDFLVEKQVEMKTFESRIKSLQDQIEDVQNQGEKQKGRLELTTQKIESYEQEVEQIQCNIETLQVENMEVAESQQDKEEVLSNLKDKFSELLIAMQEREDEVKDLTSRINKAEKEIVQYEGKAEQYLTDEEQITRNIFEKYRVDLREILGSYLEYNEDDFSELNNISNMFFMETEDGQVEIEKEGYGFVRRYGQDLRECGQKLKQYKNEFNRLGEINWQAIEDYNRQKLRYDFLKQQEEELKKSLEDLQRAIDHIDTKSRERFKDAFDEVNMRFEKVFPIIFGGGNAKLQVVGHIDSPECGIDIIAQPPGKKMQNINLMSGGEKAMTAVSLIFSIFLVKPSPFCLLDEVDAPLDDANVGRFNELLREMSQETQFILITHNKKTMELNDTLYGVTMQEAGVSNAVSVRVQ